MSNQRKMGRIALQQLTFMAIMIALNIVLTRYAAITVSVAIRFSLGLIPIFLTGIFLGPIQGAVVGVLSDLMGVLMAATGAFHAGITLTAGVRGALAGLVILLFSRRKYWLSFITLSFVDMVIGSLLLMSFWLKDFKHIPYLDEILIRLPNSLILFVVHSIVLICIVPLLEKRLPHRMIKPVRV